MRAIIETMALRERRLYLRWTIVFAVLTVALVILYAAVLQNAVLITLSAITAFFMLAFLVLGQFAGRATARRMLDIAYVRLSGALKVESYPVRSAGGPITRHRVLLGEHQIHVDPQIAAALESAGSATLTFVPFTYGRNILFEVLDAQGQVLYRRAGYQP